MEWRVATSLMGCSVCLPQHRRVDRQLLDACWLFRALFAKRPRSTIASRGVGWNPETCFIFREEGNFLSQKQQLEGA
jgi:hypothetical protein